VNHFYAHAPVGEPAVSLNDHNPADPFAVVRLGDGWDFTTHDPGYCRRVAAAWTAAADLLEAARQRAPQHQADREAEQ